MGQNLQAIADAQHRDLELEDTWVRLGSRLIEDAAGATREDDATGLTLRNFSRRGIVREDGRVDLTLTDTPGDDLGVLRTKIEYDNLLLHWNQKQSFMGYPLPDDESKLQHS